jgi:hypothetical protein
MKAGKLRAVNDDVCKQAGKNIFIRRHTEIPTNGGELVVIKLAPERHMSWAGAVQSV